MLESHPQSEAFFVLTGEARAFAVTSGQGLEVDGRSVRDFRLLQADAMVLVNGLAADNCN